MKRSILFKNYFKVVGVAVLMSLGFVACDDDDVVPVADKAQVAVLNLLTNDTGLDAYLGETKINTAAITGPSFAYLTIDAKMDRLSIFAAGETDTLVSANHDFKAGELFSAIVLGDQEGTELIIVSDDLKVPAGGKAKIRFANLLDSGIDLDLWIADAEEALQSEAAYPSVNPFIEVEPASESTLQVRGVDSEEVLVELEDVKFETGKIYTVIVLNKLIDGVATPVIQIVENK